MKSKDIIPSVTIEMAEDRHMYNSISVQFRSERLKRNSTMD
jgi:hypothetical protein